MMNGLMRLHVFACMAVIQYITLSSTMFVDVL